MPTHGHACVAGRKVRFRTQRGWDHQRLRWVAERIDGMDAGLHTVITTDLDELRAALASDLDQTDL